MLIVMDKDAETQRIMQKAYKVFRAELDGHMLRAKEALLVDAPPSEDIVRRSSASFHTIKGGAGFFGLDHVALIAGKLEKMLNAPYLSVQGELDKIRLLVNELDELAKTLPDASKGES